VIAYVSDLLPKQRLQEIGLDTGAYATLDTRYLRAFSSQSESGLCGLKQTVGDTTLSRRARKTRGWKTPAEKSKASVQDIDHSDG
jgi:hypothetical protein